MCSTARGSRRLLDVWAGASVWCRRRCLSGAPRRTVHRFDADSPFPASFFRPSTHAFGVGDAVELARALDQLPRALVVFGVEARRSAPAKP